MIPNQSTAAVEVIDADSANCAYKRRIGKAAFLAERNALHDAWRAMAKRMRKPDLHLDVAKAMAAEHRTDDNWGLLVLVFAERLRAEQVYEDFKREEAAGKRKPAQRRTARH